MTEKKKGWIATPLTRLAMTGDIVKWALCPFFIFVEFMNSREKIESLIAPVIQAMGYEIWYVDLHRSKQKTLLRIYVDLPLGDERKSVNLDDCGLISSQVGALLDVEESMPGSYFLEVSSPGLDRALFKLEHYQRYIGGDIKISLYEPLEGARNYKGKILSANDGKIKLEVDGKEIIFEISSICKAKLI